MPWNRSLMFPMSSCGAWVATPRSSEYQADQLTLIFGSRLWLKNLVKVEKERINPWANLLCSNILARKLNENSLQFQSSRTLAGHPIYFITAMYCAVAALVVTVWLCSFQPNLMSWLIGRKFTNTRWPPLRFRQSENKRTIFAENQHVSYVIFIQYCQCG